MNGRLINIFIFALLFPVLSTAAQKTHMRGERYCEIIVAKNFSTYAVYNSWGLSKCPEASWNNVSVAQIKKETHSPFIHLNGPRYWVIDGFKNSKLVNADVKTLSGIPMREAGILHMSLFDSLKSKPYQVRHVDRQTTWVYQAGKPVYELIAPNGQVFVMQSYSTQKSPQSTTSLNQLGSTLTLPKGWHFKTGLIQTSETLTAINGTAIVVQDNFLNTYQLATHDFLQNKPAKVIGARHRVFT